MSPPVTTYRPVRQPLRLLQESLQRSALAAPGKIALVSGSERISYATLWGHAVRIANALRAREVRRGDRVAIYLDNSWQCAAAIYGTLLADAAFVLINPQTKSSKLAYIVKDSGAKVLFAEVALLRFVQPALAELDEAPALILAGALPNGEQRFDALSDVLRQTDDAPPTCANINMDLAALIYTSGSTGEPKGVMHSHQSMSFALESLVEYLGIDSEDRIVCMLPLSFDYGLYQLLMSVHTGATLILETSFAYPAQVLKLLDSEQVTVVPGVPTVFAMLLATDDATPLRFPAVRKVTNTAASLPAGYNSRLQAIFPRAQVFRMYGLTECKRVCYLDPARIEEKPESVGKAIPGTETLLLDEQGHPVGIGQPGILHVRGQHVMLGYWRQPEKTARMLRHGPMPGERMLCTQDYFTQDAEGFLYFVGRSDSIIKSRGEKVSPVEVEAVLYSLPGVRDAAVLGIPDAVMGHAIHAAVALNAGSELTPAMIKKLCASRLENHMVPSRVVLMPELPKSANGKIDNHALAGMLAAQ